MIGIIKESYEREIKYLKKNQEQLLIAFKEKLKYDLTPCLFEALDSGIKTETQNERILLNKLKDIVGVLKRYGITFEEWR